MNYNPPPTDAVLLNPDGTANGPVNPEICASRGDCAALVANLKGARIIPAGTDVLIQDEPWTESASIRYGKDGRRVFGIHFTVDKIAYWENVELLFVWLKRDPYPGSQWKLTPNDLIRVGNVVGEPIAANAPALVMLRRMTAGATITLQASPFEGRLSPHYPILAATKPAEISEKIL
jgi:hypothetical protein